MLGAEAWTFMSGSLPGWIFLVALVLIFYLFGQNDSGFNSASGFRILYDRFHGFVFPRLSGFRESYAGSILRIHSGRRCNCKHAHGFYEYFIYNDSNCVNHIGAGGITFDEFMSRQGFNCDLLVSDLLVGDRDYYKKIFTFSENLIIRIPSPTAVLSDDFRYMFFDDAYFLVTKSVSDEQFYAYFRDHALCGAGSNFASSPTDELLDFVKSKREACVQKKEAFIEFVAGTYIFGLDLFHDRLIDLLMLMAEVIDHYTITEPGFDKQVLFEILLMRRYISAGDKSYSREVYLAGLLRKLVVHHKKRRVKKIFLLLEKYCYERDKFEIALSDVRSSCAEVVPLDQEFRDFHHGACQDYDEIRC